MDILFDIIDTLLAQKEFDEAGCTDPQTDEGDDTTDENNDEGDDDTDNQDSDDDAIPTATPADHTQGEVLNADGIDAIIRQRVKIGMIGKALNLDGVEDMSQEGHHQGCASRDASGRQERCVRERCVRVRRRRCRVPLQEGRRLPEEADVQPRLSHPCQQRRRFC